MAVLVAALPRIIIDLLIFTLIHGLEQCRYSERSVALCMCIGKPFMESHVTNYNKIYAKNPILFWERYLFFINVNLAWMSTGAIRMVSLHFYTLLVQWTFTTLRVYQAYLFDVVLQFCGPYVCLYSKCGQSISWLLTSGDSLPLPTSRVKQSKKRISWEMSVYKCQEHELLKLGNISSKKFYAGEFNILIGVMARLQKFNFIYWKVVSENLLF